MSETILITGGAGFIGSHLCERLAQDKEKKIISLDNYSTGVKANHMENVEYLIGETSDISKIVTCEPDIVFHLGEYSRVEQSFNEMEKVWRYNKSGTFAVLEFCRLRSSKLIYAGSSTKFGDGGLGRNQSPYGWTKASNTELVVNYGKWFDLDYVITYFYNVYGPREISSGKYATLIGLFAEKMRVGDPLTVVSPGTQRRNFTYVGDVVDALVLLGSNAHGDEYGIGAEKSYSIHEVAKMFGGPIEILPERQGNRLTANLMNEKLVAMGWQPKTSLFDYIEKLRLMNWAQL